MSSFGHIGQELWKSTPRWIWGVGRFISPSVSGCKWTQSRSWGPHYSYWCGMTPYSADRKRTGIFCLSVCLENGMKDVSIAFEWV